MLLHINKEVSNYFKTDHDVLFLIVAPIIIKFDNNNLEKQCVIYSMCTCAYTTNGLSVVTHADTVINIYRFFKTKIEIENTLSLCLRRFQFFFAMI